MSKYDILKELITQWAERELENAREAQKLAGMDSPGHCLAAGAYDAYQQVLEEIAELEREVQPS